MIPASFFLASSMTMSESDSIIFPIHVAIAAPKNNTIAVAAANVRNMVSMPPPYADAHSFEV